MSMIMTMVFGLHGDLEFGIGINDFHDSLRCI